ncbi:hypothetical protein CCY99_07790 [Helicobacter sp. 16-1353]|uniref:amidohydrolase family protein n=1 Tax=Helicobacter sp. 16-1353 TaxID=2004996 RepID=UPI000DCE1A7A|nr:amidohydrolase family protein [Helicobacter sp. 16-1353]RAX52043.1 hypothetical protein CCY99_07790 [Helicobacter sp. 16-1353]
MILKNAFIYDTSIKQKCDIQIKNGIIVKIDSNISDNDDILDCTNKTIMPQFIDLNVLPKNKTLSRKSLLSLAEKSMKGGVGSIVLNSDTNPKIDNEMAIEFIKGINNDLQVDIYPSISSVNNENKICDISIMHSLGGIGISLQSNQSPNTIDKIAKYAKMLDIPIFVNADDNLGGVINYGVMSAKLGLPPKNPLSEIKEVAKILEVAIFYNIKIVFRCIVEPRSIKLINEAKKLNKNIFCETSIHHLILNDESCDNYNTSAKINPPLKDKKTQEILIENLKENNIDLLTSLQCACYNSLKEKVFSEAEFGIDGIAYYFSLIFTNLVKNDIIDLQKISTICSKNPAKILNLNYGEIKVGKLAKLMVLNLKSSYKIEDFFLPYNNQICDGVIEKFI